MFVLYVDRTGVQHHTCVELITQLRRLDSGATYLCTSNLITTIR